MGGSPLPMMEYKDFSRNVHIQAGEHGKVVNAQIELTYGCNLHCVHCYTDCYNRPDLLKQEMPIEEVLRILDELYEQGVLWVCLTGGEIFVRKDFLAIYAYAKQKGFLITLFTNGTLITERIAEYLKEHPPFSIDISCHAATEETFDQVTQVKGSFQRFLKGVRLLVERGLPVKFKTKAMTLNKQELEDIRALVEGYGGEFRLSHAIYPRLDGDLVPTEYRLSPEEILGLEYPEEDSCSAAAPQEAFSPPTDDRLFRCGCGTTSVHVSAWGKLGACTWGTEPRVDLRQRSVAAGIAEVFPKIRNTRYQGDSPCRSCQVYTLCGKKPAIAGAEAGDPEQPVAHFCQVAFGRAEKHGFQAACPVGPLRSSSQRIHKET